MKQTKKEILKKYDLFGDPERIWADDAEKAMQEYADLFYKEKLREDVPSEEEIEEFIISHPDNTGNFILGAGISAGFKVGAKWAIEQTIKRTKTE